MKYFTGKP